MAKYAVEAIIHGRVQGVWFRGSTQEEANRIGGIGGWVRNMPDGTVMLHAEGEKANVDKLLAWCHMGPDLAHVTKVDVKQVEPQGYEGSLRVKY